jgi:hypothetical protein
MARAYEILGYPNPYHFSSIWANARDSDLWLEAFQAKWDGAGAPFGRAQWDQLLGHCGAVTDQPAILFAEELLAAYPDAKVVLVERDVEAWYRSISALFDVSLAPTFLGLRFLDPYWIGRIIRVGVVSFGYAFGQASNPTIAGLKCRARQGYREYYANIRALVPPERLLEYRFGDGWEPLCTFLGKPVPKEPFPHLNESRDLQEMFERFAIKAVRRSAVNVAVVVAGTVALVFVALRLRDFV